MSPSRRSLLATAAVHHHHPQAVTPGQRRQFVGEPGAGLLFVEQRSTELHEDLFWRPRRTDFGAVARHSSPSVSFKPSSRFMSMNQLWILSLRALTRSTTRSENDTGDSPGVHDRHFWLPE